MNTETGLSTGVDLVTQRSAAHEDGFLADKRIIDERFQTNPAQALLWALKGFPELVAVLNLHADAKAMGVCKTSG